MFEVKEINLLIIVVFDFLLFGFTLCHLSSNMYGIYRNKFEHDILGRVN
jgi:hypothetical protein